MSFLDSPHRSRTVTDLEQEIDQLHLRLGFLRQQAAKSLQLRAVVACCQPYG
ncbi:MAG: hypothetical protein ACRC67_43650 [Inquilinus sp.]|uniref:hypothetical protein n=1 Tax=Inquilinus sp. TaxID=1932117 RepID=UPI003F38B32C